MQMIEAVIKPERLDAVKDALKTLGIMGATALEARGFGRQGGHTEQFRGATTEVHFVQKVMLKVVVKNDQVEAGVRAIIEAARTGAMGDGKIFVMPVTQVYRIRTGERDEAAI